VTVWLAAITEQPAAIRRSMDGGHARAPVIVYVGDDGRTLQQSRRAPPQTQFMTAQTIGIET